MISIHCKGHHHHWKLMLHNYDLLISLLLQAFWPNRSLICRVCFTPNMTQCVGLCRLSIWEVSARIRFRLIRYTIHVNHRHHHHRYRHCRHYHHRRHLHYHRRRHHHQQHHHVLTPYFTPTISPPGHISLFYSLDIHPLGMDYHHHYHHDHHHQQQQHHHHHHHITIITIVIIIVIIIIVISSSSSSSSTWSSSSKSSSSSSTTSITLLDSISSFAIHHNFKLCTLQLMDQKICGLVFRHTNTPTAAILYFLRLGLCSRDDDFEILIALKVQVTRFTTARLFFKILNQLDDFTI